ncbi:MAG TPA: J domain-containing protein [Desulfuromonadales bacterium]|nr:J domain-containing protein [Desulfuromonadales bacterium]
MTYADLLEAVQTLGLHERSTISEIKSRHRELVKRYHPDTGHADGQEAIRNINAAFRVLLDYIEEYRLSFTEEEFYEQNPEERIRRQFMNDPLWGKN